MSIAEGDQLANEQSQDYRLKFAGAFPKTPKTRLITVDFAWQPSPARSNCPMPTPKKAAAPKNALSKPVQPDAALAAVVGKDPLPRTELTKRLWEYIRKHELQDPKDKRSIRADEKLLAVFDGKKVVSMFEMTKLVNGHLV
jgi:chromatin remodeling complex protein RSC6